MEFPIRCCPPRVCYLLIFLLPGLAAVAPAQLVVPGAPGTAATKQTTSAPAQKANDTSTVDLPGSTQWKDTGIDLQAGDRVLITATGQLQYGDAQKPAGPEGQARGWKDMLRILPMNDSGRGALLGRIGDSDASQPFLVGARHEVRAPVAGRLFLGINQMSSDQGDGTLHVTLQVLERGGAAGSGHPVPLAVGDKVPAFTKDMLEKIPRRISDDAGHEGDMTNFIILGSEDRMRQVYQQAGWVVVDRTKKEAILHGILSSITKQSYVEMPMSELFLFGRAQDYGLAQAEPFEVVFQRHHLRLWKAPFTAAGQTVWVGAGTHDMGLERDQRNNGVTHKIDPDIDKEREHIGSSLSATGHVAAMTYLKPTHSLGQEHTATGGLFHTDGRVLILQLRGSSTDRRAAFASLFCSVLEKEHPDAGDWGPCSDYIEAPPAERVALGTLTAKYRLAIVPGVLSACASGAPAFKEGQERLRTAYGITVDLLSAPNRSSQENGAEIASFLKEQYQKDRRKFIVLGYSKGAPDVMEGLANDPDALAAVAAFVTVAGAIGGSPIADLMTAEAEQWIKAYNLADCQGDLTAAFKSLRRDIRQSFLSRYPAMGVPVYSVAAVSEKSNTSKVLLENWQLMAVYAQQQDSQLARTDAVFPGGTDLGNVRADHLAVAMPFEDSTNASLQKVVDHNHYPRTALLEALMRFVTRDLEAAASH